MTIHPHPTLTLTRRWAPACVAAVALAGLAACSHSYVVELHNTGQQTYVITQQVSQSPATRYETTIQPGERARFRVRQGVPLAASSDLSVSIVGR